MDGVENGNGTQAARDAAYFNTTSTYQTTQRDPECLYQSHSWCHQSGSLWSSEAGPDLPMGPVEQSRQMCSVRYNRRQTSADRTNPKLVCLLGCHPVGRQLRKLQQSLHALMRLLAEGALLGRRGLGNTVDRVCATKETTRGSSRHDEACGQ